MWPAIMVQHLSRILPEEYTAEPRVHLGASCEIDVSAYESDHANPSPWTAQSASGTAVATWAPPAPTLSIAADLEEQPEYEVRVYDQSRGRKLVAAVEIVSPGNKDRTENRRAFLTKCAALLHTNVCISIVDLITTRAFNVYAELLGMLARGDSASASRLPPAYAVTCRAQDHGRRLDTWAYPLALGQPLPKLPLWLNDSLAIDLELESTYEEACRALRIV